MALSLIELALLCCLLTCAAARKAHFTYVGCYQDGDNSNRDLNALIGLGRIGPYPIYAGGNVHSLESMSHEFCSRVCALGGFPYFGVQVGKHCFCGKSYGLHGSVSESQCNSACTGNATQKCGGFAINSVFAQTYPNNNAYFALKQFDTAMAAPESSALPTAAQSDADCLIECSARVACQGVAFSKRLLACRQLALAYPPGSLVGPDWAVFVKN